LSRETLNRVVGLRSGFGTRAVPTSLAHRREAPRADHGHELSHQTDGQQARLGVQCVRVAGRHRVFYDAVAARCTILPELGDPVLLVLYLLRPGRTGGSAPDQPAPQQSRSPRWPRRIAAPTSGQLPLPHDAERASGPRAMPAFRVRRYRGGSPGARRPKRRRRRGPRPGSRRDNDLEDDRRPRGVVVLGSRGHQPRSRSDAAAGGAVVSDDK
jgi:hypothetical protein